MLHFGKDYAKQVVANSKALANALDREGSKVLYGDLGYTESHTILVEHPKAIDAVTLLDSAGVLVNPSSLPWNKNDEVTGLRLGTQVLTRRGLTESDMPQVARIIHRVFQGHEEPEVIYYRMVQPLVSHFKRTAFSFDEEFSSGFNLDEQLYKSYKADSIPTILRSSPAFANCELNELESIENYFELIKIKKSEVLFNAGSQADAVYFIAYGTVDIIDDAAGVTVIRQHYNTHFGELGVMRNSVRKYTACVESPGLLIKIKAVDFRCMLERFDSVNVYFRRYISSFNDSGDGGQVTSVRGDTHAELFK
jgi:hypothetical protein